MNPILLLFLLVKTAVSLSGCEVCASYGQCNAAFHNGPGQYCGSFYDISTSGNKPCCCPLQSTCKVSPTQCSCHVSNPQPTPPINYYPSSQHSSSRPHTTYYNEYQTTSPFAQGLFAPILFIVIICCCCALCSRHRGEHHGDGRIPLATAVPATCPPSENPAHYTHNFNYGSTTSYGPPASGGSSGGGAGAAIASGLGGLAFGTLFGNLMGRNNDAQGNSMPQFGGGYQGGYDIAGDSGDGYDIAGDSGGGGYDIDGDSGDGGFDIAGDSGD